MIGHTRELLLNWFWIAILQNMVIIAVHLISLKINNPPKNGVLLLSFLLAFCFVFKSRHSEQYHEEIDVIMII